jgi:mannose-6-phosphate isomerase-like protein (cupin superfamily)
MYRSSEDRLSYKYGDHGPGYFYRGPTIDVGVVVLRPGDEYPNHFHARSENTFFGLEGEAALWSDRRDRLPLRAGDMHRFDPGEMHYLVNEGEQPWRALFIRAPHDPSDTTRVLWRPGAPDRTETDAGRDA